MPRACQWEKALADAGQEHVLSHWNQLSDAQCAALEAQIADIDRQIGLGKLSGIVTETAKAVEEEKSSSSGIQPPAKESQGFADGTAPDDEEKWRNLGLELVAQGKCAAVVLAGGQGTRLGVTYPKGLLGDSKIDAGDIGLPSGKSLFQIQAERIQRVQSLAKALGKGGSCTIPWVVMTSEATHDTTTAFFESRGYFGLSPDQVRFMRQGCMPCLDEQGKMLMASPHEIAVAPDGNGGFYAALARSGVLDWLTSSGVQWVQVFSVDNILIRAADPVFYGYCEATGADAAAKTIPKKSWDEAVGVFACRDGKPGVIEYSEIGEVRAKEVDADGVLRYNAANPAIHAYSIAFLNGPVTKAGCLPWHLARKEIPTKDGKVKGIKAETFIFDAFSFANVFRLLQVSRAAEFSAIKNSDEKKKDTPATALESLTALHREWLRKAGADVHPERQYEVSPLVSYAGEGLAEHPSVKLPQTEIPAHIC